MMRFDFMSKKGFIEQSEDRGAWARHKCLQRLLVGRGEAQMSAPAAMAEPINIKQTIVGTTIGRPHGSAHKLRTNVIRSIIVE